MAEDRPVLDVVGDRHLDQNTVDILVGVEVLDGVVQFGGVRVGVNVDVDGLDTDLLAVVLFHRDVRLAGRVLGHQHRRQRRAFARVGEAVDGRNKVVPNRLCDGVAVDNLCH